VPFEPSEDRWNYSESLGVAEDKVEASIAYRQLVPSTFLLTFKMGNQSLAKKRLLFLKVFRWFVFTTKKEMF